MGKKIRGRKNGLEEQFSDQIKGNSSVWFNHGRDWDTNICRQDP